MSEDGFVPAEQLRVTWAQASAMINKALFDQGSDWGGAPMPVDGLPLVVEDRHPLAAKYAELQRVVDEAAGVAPPDQNTEMIEVVNHWVSPAKQVGVTVYRRVIDGRVRTRAMADPSDGVGRKARMMIDLLKVSTVWSLNAEVKAMERLAELVPNHLWRSYVMTGHLLETSKRSGLTYVFRRCRPTLVLSGHNRDPEDSGLRVMTALCLHPIAFYQGTTAGGMVPTDDVIAHLLMMRGDEHLYWKRANQHEPWVTEAML